MTGETADIVMWGFGGLAIGHIIGYGVVVPLLKKFWRSKDGEQ